MVGALLQNNPCSFALMSLGLGSNGNELDDRYIKTVWLYRSMGGGPIVVENRKGVFSRYPKKESGSWGESDRGGTRLCEKVHNVLAEWKVYWDLIG